ncbi:hypothetical protein SK128_023255, partial [Halocaridina rubra]
SRRTFLSAAYRCDEAWNLRLQNPLLSNLNAGDYTFDLERKYKQEGTVSAIDVDLFVNSLEGDYARDFTQDLDELMNRLRRSPETIRTLPSTPYAALRILLDTRRTKLLLKFLTNPLEYGVFPNYHIANLMMDTYLEDKNYTAAARVASVQMLQEDFGPPLTQTLTILSCYAYYKSEENLPWEEYSMELPEPEEEVKVRIQFKRNPYFDDHFDLKDPYLIVGKTLAWGSPLLGGEIGLNCEILGWALYKKWKELSAALTRAIDSDLSLASSVVTSVKDSLASCETSNLHATIMSHIIQIEATNSKVMDMNIESLLQDLVKREAANAEANDIKAQKEVFTEWEKKREEDVKKQLQDYRKRQLLAEIEEKKQALKAKEEVIFFFDNKDKLEMLLDRKPKPKEIPRRFFFPFKKKQHKKADEDYIPPEV